MDLPPTQQQSQPKVYRDSLLKMSCHPCGDDSILDGKYIQDIDIQFLLEGIFKECFPHLSPPIFS